MHITLRIELGLDAHTRCLLQHLIGSHLSDSDKAALQAATDQLNQQTSAVQAALDDAPKPST